MFGRKRVKENPYKKGDFVKFKKGTDKSIYKVDYVSEDFVKLVNTVGWFDFKRLMLVSKGTKLDKRG